jgi:hypothetical protein
LFPFSARATPKLITKSVESITSVIDPFICFLPYYFISV